MSLYDIGRPTGALGGLDYARQQNLDQREQTLRTDANQAQFFDYMDQQKSRLAKYDYDELKARADTRILPGAEDAAIAKNKYSEAKSNSDLKMLPEEENLRGKQIRESMRNISRNMKDDQKKDSVSNYYSMLEGLEMGMSYEEVFNRGKAALLDAAVNKKRAKAKFKAFGIENYSPENMRNLMYMSSYDLHSVKLSEAEHLKQMDLEIAVAKGKSTGKDFKPQQASAQHINDAVNMRRAAEAAKSQGNMQEYSDYTLAADNSMKSAKIELAKEQRTDATDTRLSNEEAVKLLPGFPSDSDPSPDLLHQYNTLFNEVQLANKTITDPREIRRRLNQLFEYDEGAWELGQGKLVPRTPEAYRENILGERGRVSGLTMQQGVSDLLDNPQLTPEIKQRALDALTEVLKSEKLKKTNPKQYKLDQLRKQRESNAQ